MHALVFDLDGTLVDSVYAHVLAWQVCLAKWASTWMAIGFTAMSAQAAGAHHPLCPAGKRVDLLADRSTPSTAGTRNSSARSCRSLNRCPGRSKYSAPCGKRRCPTPSPPLIGRSLTPRLRRLELGRKRGRGWARNLASLEPIFFWQAGSGLAGGAEDCIVVGDAVWDHAAARRAGMLSVGVFTGGYGEEELYHAGAFRVYRSIADLLQNLDELGILL